MGGETAPLIGIHTRGCSWMRKLATFILAPWKTDRSTFWSCMWMTATVFGLVSNGTSDRIEWPHYSRRALLFNSRQDCKVKMCGLDRPEGTQLSGVVTVCVRRWLLTIVFQRGSAALPLGNGCHFSNSKQVQTCPPLLLLTQVHLLSGPGTPRCKRNLWHGFYSWKERSFDL